MESLVLLSIGAIVVVVQVLLGALILRQGRKNSGKLEEQVTNQRQTLEKAFGELTGLLQQNSSELNELLKNSSLKILQELKLQTDVQQQALQKAVGEITGLLQQTSSELKEQLEHTCQEILKELKDQGETQQQTLQKSLSKLVEVLQQTSSELKEQLNDGSLKTLGVLNNLESHWTIRFLQLRDMLMLYSNSVAIKSGKWILEKNQVQKIFRPGELCEVKDPANDTLTTYTHKNDEIVSETISGGKLQCRIILTVTGMPKSGTLYDENGKPAKTFSYDELGQLNDIQ